MSVVAPTASAWAATPVPHFLQRRPDGLRRYRFRMGIADFMPVQQGGEDGDQGFSPTLLAAPVTRCRARSRMGRHRTRSTPSTALSVITTAFSFIDLESNQGPSISFGGEVGESPQVGE